MVEMGCGNWLSGTNLDHCLATIVYRPSHFEGKLFHLQLELFSGKKNQHKHKLFGPNFLWTFPTLTQQLRFGVFREGVFQKMPALEGKNFWRKKFCEICAQKSTSEHRKTQNKALRRGSWTTPSQRPLFVSCWLTPGCLGSKSFFPLLGPQGIPLFGADVHDFRRGRPWPEGFSKNFVQKKFALIFWPYLSGDAQTVICKPCSENSWTKGWKWGVQSCSARNSLKITVNWPQNMRKP